MMATSVRILAAVFVLVSLGTALPSRDALAGASGARAVRSESSVTLTLRLADGRREFRPGEIIPIQLEFASEIRNRFVVDGATYDRSGRLTIDEFRIEPDDAVIDPLLDYLAANPPAIGGGIRGTGVLGEKPFVVTLQLNDWFRFDRPGTYQLSIRSHRVEDETQSTITNRVVIPVESNTITFEMLPRDSRWEAEELQRAVQHLESRDSPIDRRDACRTLRFLGTDTAVDEMIARLGDQQSDCAFDVIAGLYGAPNRRGVVQRMEARLRASDQPVTQRYLRTLAVLSIYTARPELRAPQTRESKGRLPGPGELARRPELIQAEHARRAAALVDVLPGKAPRARAVTLESLLEATRWPGGASAPAQVTEDLRRQVALSFLDLPRASQVRLLGYQWTTVASPEMLPALRALASGGDSSPDESVSVADLALRRLHELSPAEARPLILRALADPPPGATFETLAGLPDRELPDLDDVLVANINPDSGLTDLHADLLNRYASVAALPRVLSLVKGRFPRMACRPQASLLAYFLRAHEEVGKQMLDAVLASRRDTGCFKSVLKTVADLRMTAAVETTALAHLDDPDPEVVAGAVHALGQHGSPAARRPVRDRFARWHAQWQGREDDLRYRQSLPNLHTSQAMLESAFMQALGRGQAWLADAAELRRLRAFCVTGNCHGQADHLIRIAGDRTIRVVSFESDARLLITLGPYDFRTMGEVKRKLQQYPKGISFSIEAHDQAAGSRASAALLDFAAAQGISIVR